MRSSQNSGVSHRLPSVPPTGASMQIVGGASTPLSLNRVTMLHGVDGGISAFACDSRAVRFTIETLFGVRSEGMTVKSAHTNDAAAIAGGA